MDYILFHLAQPASCSVTRGDWPVWCDVSPKGQSRIRIIWRTLGATLHKNVAMLVNRSWEMFQLPTAELPNCCHLHVQNVVWQGFWICCYCIIQSVLPPTIHTTKYIQFLYRKKLTTSRKTTLCINIYVCECQVIVPALHCKNLWVLRFWWLTMSNFMFCS